MYVCSCFGVTEEQVREHAEGGACTPRQVAAACGAGTDCGSCVRRIQAVLGRGECPRRAAVERGEPALEPMPAGATQQQPAVEEPAVGQPTHRPTPEPVEPAVPAGEPVALPFPVVAPAAQLAEAEPPAASESAVREPVGHGSSLAA